MHLTPVPGVGVGVQWGLGVASLLFSTLPPLPHTSYRLWSLRTGGQKSLPAPCFAWKRMPSGQQVYKYSFFPLSGGPVGGSTLRDPLYLFPLGAQLARGKVHSVLPPSMNGQLIPEQPLLSALPQVKATGQPQASTFRPQSGGSGTGPCVPDTCRDSYLLSKFVKYHSLAVGNG